MQVSESAKGFGESLKGRLEMKGKKVSGKRVYVTFLKDGTIAFHPSNCTGEHYRMKGEGSVHLPKSTSATVLGETVLKVRQECKTQ
jgi:hypothetical protein